ncbi:AEC family transporter [Flaviflagellibacter deserti]|uniref:AEC family transporter n=1 Tax=Flaviflagellibacter deserti TaxID=2267266 RepID=A0ABV9Z339_9HYPH
MLATLSVVLPIFGLVLAGFICRRTGILGPAALTELNRFVVWLGLPALFLKITVHASWDELYQPGFMVVFGLSCFILFFATILIRMRKKGLADASVEGLDAAYPNAGYMGFPLCFLVFGAESFPVVTIAAITTACVMFAMAIVLLEIGIQTERHPGRMALAVSRSLIKNPLVVSPAIGIAFAASGLPLPKAADTFLDLLSAAASPCALVALGLFLAAERAAVDKDRAGAILLTLLKLFVQPALTYVLAYHAFDLPKVTADTAILISALPTGTGPFMLAEYYKRDAAVTADTILYSTLASVLTISALLYVSGHTG